MPYLDRCDRCHGLAVVRVAWGQQRLCACRACADLLRAELAAPDDGRVQLSAFDRALATIQGRPPVPRSGNGS